MSKQTPQHWKHVKLPAPLHERLKRECKDSTPTITLAGRVEYLIIKGENAEKAEVSNV